MVPNSHPVALVAPTTYKNALQSFMSYIQDYGKLKQVEQYALASAGFIYESKLQFIRPQDNRVEYLKKCAPIAHGDYGKTVSAYGGLRISPDLAVSYARWGKAMQLSWGRAQAVPHRILR